ncbi:OmpA family protein, partial [Chitinophaga sp.]|uniref:OmpA family protein n=1 Tax=Chitinophaga sp. TaxID=1869181 RepID=UPI002F92B7A3
GSKQYDNRPVEQAVEAPAVVAPVVAVAAPVTPDRNVVDYADKTIDSSPENIPWQTTNPGSSVTASTSSNNNTTIPVHTSQAAYSSPEVVSWQPSGSMPASFKGGGSYALVKDSAVKALESLWKVPGFIYYDLNSYVPQDQEWRKLDSIFQIWKANPHRIILVNGHTDIIGTERYNLSLSKNRAVYIQECLLSRGVDADKIKINYFGSTRPVWIAKQYSLDNDRDIFIELQGVNRRCEIKIQ